MLINNTFSLIKGKLVEVNATQIITKKGKKMHVIKLTVEASVFETIGTAVNVVKKGNWYLKAFGTNVYEKYEGSTLYFLCNLDDRLVTSRKAVLKSDEETPFTYHTLEQTVISFGESLAATLRPLGTRMSTVEREAKDMEDITLDDIFAAPEGEEEIVEEDKKEEVKKAPKKAPKRAPKKVAKKEEDEEYDEDDSSEFDE